MRYSDDFLDELRTRLPVSEVVGRRVKLRKAGREWRGLSPFNQEKTPSFFVNDHKMAWFDFSSGKNGNIFDFVMLTEGVTFPEAVERLASQVGMPLPKVTGRDEAREARRKSLHEVVELAAKFFETTLASRLGLRARDYLAHRAIEPKTQLEFRIGYAPADRFALKEFLGGQGISVPDMIEAGLVIGGEDIAVPYDRFRNRVIIPIHDQRGRLIGFGGRTLDDEVQPKYLNTPETPLFHKGHVVFNFHRARQPAHEEDSVVVVEGYLDAISVYQAGLKCVVATMGTAFTEEQIAALWRLSTEPVVCFDADRAGISAAHRAVDRILPVLKAGRTFRFALMHDSKDPDELIREKGMGAFRSVLSGSLPISDVLWHREIDHADVRTPDAQAAVESRLQTILASITDPVLNQAYRRDFRVRLASYFWEVARSASRPAKTGARAGFIKQAIKAPEGNVQKVLLGLLVHYPEFVEQKSDQIADLRFAPRLEKFRQALYDLLILHEEVSVQIIYSRLGQEFYAVLEEIHGREGQGVPWGHRLLQKFPILKVGPPAEFVSRCIDHLANKLRVAQIADDIADLRAKASGASAEAEAAAEMLLKLIREFQVQHERFQTEDAELAEEAMGIRRVYAPGEWSMAA